MNSKNFKFVNTTLGVKANVQVVVVGNKNSVEVPQCKPSYDLTWGLGPYESGSQKSVSAWVSR